MMLGHKGINSGRVLKAARGDAAFLIVSEPRLKPRAVAEAYRISVSGDTVAVEGRDPIRAMYGVFDPTERINGAPGSDWLRQLCGGSHSYWSDSYWQRFPDLLARNRETTYFVKNGEAAR